MSDKRNRTVLRLMAWERAKGELRSMLHTFYDEQEEFEVHRSKINDFISAIEDGWEIQLLDESGNKID